MYLINQAVAQPDFTLAKIPVRLDRQKLAKRLWRAVAEDGVEIGCELERPLQPGDTVYQTAQARYVVTQEPEAVLEITLAIAPSAAAAIGWAIGNLHLELMSEPERLLALDDKAVRRLLERLGVPFRETLAVFRPGRFARGDNSKKDQVDELGASHKH